MNNDKQIPDRNWSELIKEARKQAPPEVDVKHAVMAEIRHTPQDRSYTNSSMMSSLAALTESVYLKPALAFLFIISCSTGYIGYQGMDIVYLFNSISI